METFKIKNYLFLMLLFLSSTIVNSENYCTPNSFCDECLSCKERNSSLCNCDFTNSFCRKKEPNFISLLFDEEFMDSYKDCILSDNLNIPTSDICGKSDIADNIYLNEKYDLLNLENYRNYFTKNNVFCYYKLHNINSNKNNVYILLSTSIMIFWMN